MPARRFAAVVGSLTAWLCFAAPALAMDFGSGEVAAACGEPSSAEYQSAVLSDSPLGYWRLCERGVSSVANYLDVTGNARALQGSPNAGGTTTPIAKSPGQSLLNEPNAYQDFSSSYINAPSATGAYAPLSQMTARGPFSVEAWVKPKSNYTTCPTCGFVVPVARSSGSWQLGWAGTAPARGRDPLWVHDGIPGPPIGANGWTFTIYDGYHKHCAGCNDDTTHYMTAHRLQTTAPIEAGRWYHLVATYDGLTMRLYVDGALAGELGVGAIGDVRSAPSGLFGFGYAADEDHSSNTGASSSGQVQLHGSIDEGAYYGHELTAPQVADHYDAASSNPLSDHAGVDSAYRQGVATDSPYLWFPLDEHYTEATSQVTCGTCPSYKRTTAANAGAVGAPMRDITGPTFPLGGKDSGLEFREGAKITTTQGPKYPVPSTSNFSIETWIQSGSGTPEQQAFFAAPNCSGCGSANIGLRLNVGSLEVRADFDGFPNNTWQQLGGQGLNDGHWHHILVVRDLTGAANWRAYVDGEATGVTRPTTNQTLFRGNYIMLGDANSYLGLTGGGRIALDEFAYYTRALSGSRVDYEAIVAARNPVWAFDEDENFYPQKASAFAENFVTIDGAYDPDFANTLFNGAEEKLAAAGSPATEFLPPTLHLELLGERYVFGPDNQAESSVDDYIDARGDGEATYSADSERMYAEGHDDVVYARVVQDPDDVKIWVQYWVFYYYNSLSTFGVGPHEGDWEMIQVGLDPQNQPDAVTFAAHDTGYGCTWPEAEHGGIAGGAPVAFVAARSHAAYPHAGETDLPFTAVDRHRGGPEGISKILPFERIDGNPQWPGWRGRWGSSRTGDFKSPMNPSEQGDKWSRPSKFHNDHLDPLTC
jgi:hypothetical protein